MAHPRVPSRVIRRGAVLRTRAAVLLVGGLLAGAAPAETIRLPAGPLADALRAVAIETGNAIVFAPEIAAGRRTPLLRLDGATPKMLRRVLAGSGLGFRFTGERTILVEALPRPRAPPPPPPEAIGANDIMVTAMRRPTRLADTPLSIVAVTGIELERARVTGLQGLAALAPSLATTNLGSGLNRLSLRGAYAAGEPTVGLYYGNVMVAGPSGSTADPSLMTPNLMLVDIDRVEVLRGPQGTLYGSGSLAGTVRILFRTPDPEKTTLTTEASGAATKDGGDSGSFSTVANLPLVRGTLAVRAVAYREVRGGVLDNVALGLSNIDRETRTGGRIALRWQIDTHWRLDLSGVIQHGRIDDTMDAEIATGIDRTAAPARTPFVDDFLLGSAELHGEIGAVSLDATLSHSRWAPHRTLDFSAVNASHSTDQAACTHYFGLGSGACSSNQIDAFAAYVDTQTPAALHQPFAVTVDSAEARLSGSGRLTWTAGGFLSLRRDHGISATRPVDAATGLIEETTAPIAYRDFTGRLNQSALFADGTWRAWNWLSLSAGARYFHYSRHAWGTVSVPNPITGPYDPSSFDQTYRAHGAVGRARIDIRPDQALLLYAQVASGFRPGGINVVPGLDPTLAAYRDDRLVSLEAGGRIRLDGERLRLDGAIYRQHWAHMQYSATSADGGYAFITNIGSARIKGGELSLSWEPGPVLIARLDATYTDARLASDQTSTTATTPGRKGDRLPYVAPIALSASLLLDRPIGDRLRLLGSVHARYIGRSRATFRGVGSAPALAMGDTGTVDADAGLARGGAQVTLFVENLADTRGRLSAITNLQDDQTLLTRPRTIGVSLRHDF
jgi:outer membrane receptor protein involved in Fe transport